MRILSLFPLVIRDRVGHFRKSFGTSQTYRFSEVLLFGVFEADALPFYFFISFYCFESNNNEDVRPT